jgi:hypothetical protein
MDHIDGRLWADVLAAEDTELGPPASGDAVAVFERMLGLSLPPSHREFLLRANGGIVGYARLFGVGRSDYLDFGRKVSEMRHEIEAMAGGPILPFASDWGGSYFCYDLRRPAEMGQFPVLLWNHEYSEEPEDRPMLWSEFAADIVGFLRRVISD